MMKFFLALSASVIMLCFSHLTKANECLNIWPYEKQLNTKQSRLIAHLSLSDEVAKVSTLNLNSKATLTTPPPWPYLELNSVSVHSGQDLTVSLVEENSVSLLLVTPLEYGSDEHGGMTTLDTVYLEWHDTAKSWPVIVLNQTSTPAKGDRQFMPGPPLLSAFQYEENAKCYTLASDFN